jgi:hypothetical protein
MNDPLIELVAREDPAQPDPLALQARHERDEAMRARLVAAIDRASPAVSRRSERGGGVLLVSLAVVVAVVGAVVAFGVVGHHTSISNPASRAGVDRSHRIPARPISLYDAGVVDVGGPVQTLLAHGNSLWVATPQRVARLDLRNGSTIARISIPTDGVNSGLAFGAGSVWLAPTGQSQLLRIDPVSNQLIATIHLGAGHNGQVPSLGGGVAFAAGMVWATRDSTGPRGDVVTVNPATNRMLGVPATVGTGPDGIVSGFGSLWVDNTSVVVGRAAPARTYPSVTRIDLPTRLVTTEPFSGTPTTGFGSLWIQTDAGSAGARLIRYDPIAGGVLARIAVPRVVAVAFGDGRVWAISYPRSRSANTFVPIKGTAALWQIDPGTNRRIGKPIQLSLTQPDAIAISRGQLWIADYDSRKVLHFQIAGSSTGGA